MSEDRVITWDELSNHYTPNNLWILIDGTVYGVSDFIVEHPGGDEPFLRYGGLDGTKAFQDIGHSQYALSLRNARKVGIIENNPCPQGHQKKVKQRKQQFSREYQQKSKQRIKSSQLQFQGQISSQTLQKHNSEQDCWIVINGKVIAVTSYLQSHPGGVGVIMQHAGKDATNAFNQAGHSIEAMQKRDKLEIGRLQKKNPSLVVILFAVLMLCVGVWFMFLS